jgi:DNA polymerase-3 subunit gamma/tau
VSSYLVLARKYRPKQFSDIVGQQSVVRTLVNAIKLKRTHQAYVFSGSRGIGKTSIARIFSKALRCPNAYEREGILYSCDECSDCREIAAGTSVNVLEIDGASNNGVENVREIRENAKFLPSSGSVKIYIIDEVHMLSNQAFNALLKTLEEPPEHVVFIFATTESHKIPETILGRCQRFDFKRVTVTQIVDRASEVLRQEGIEFEPAALTLIGRAAEGSMRDALSILDQVISFSGMRVTAAAVRESIGLIGTELVQAILGSVLERNAVAALSTLQGAFNQGVDLRALLKALIEMNHALLLMKAGVAEPETAFSPDELDRLRALLPLREIEELELVFQVYHHGLDLLSRASQPKLIFDLLIVKTALAEEIVPTGSDRVTEKKPSAPAPKREVAPQPVRATAQAAAPVVDEKAPVKAAPPVSKPAFDFRAPAPSGVRTEVRAVPVGAGAEGPRSWDGFIQFASASRPVLGILLESVVEWTLPSGADDRFRLGFRAKDRTKADQLQHKAMKDQFLLLTEGYFGFRVQPEVFFSEIQSESLAERSEREERESHDRTMQKILSHEVVQEATSLFGAQLTQIEVLKRNS